MGTIAHRRHDISEESWLKLEPLMSGQVGQHGAVARDNRQFINAVFWILRTGAPWRDLPPDLGDWKNTHRRFCRWRDKGKWEAIFEALLQDPDYEWLMIDATHVKAHHHASGAKGGSQAIARTKGGSIQRYIYPWMRLVCRSERLLQMVPHTILLKQKTLLMG